MSSAAPWLAAVRRSHDRLAVLTGDVAPEELTRPSGCSEWTVAEVLSHLGSQAEIFSLFVDAGLSGGDAPSGEAFVPIWEAWNTRSAEKQASDSVAANEAFISRLEHLDLGVLDGFRLEVFGRSVDGAGLLRMRLSEHAVHVWDVAVAFDDAAEIDGEAVALLVDGLDQTVARSGKAPAAPREVAITTTAPARRFALRAGAEGVQLELTEADPGIDRSVDIPAEALVRLVYGRLDDRHPSRGPVRLDGVTLTDLTSLFPGF